MENQKPKHKPRKQRTYKRMHISIREIVSDEQRQKLEKAVGK